MRILTGFMALMWVATFLVCCGDDVIVEPPPPLEGTYEGVYRYEKTGQPVQEQQIKWIFTTTSCLMDLDTTLQAETDRKFCDIEGRYIISDGIDVYVPIVPGTTEDNFMNRTRKACNKDLGPFGKFQLDQSVVNKVTMIRNNVADTAFQRILLTKISDEF